MTAPAVADEVAAAADLVKGKTSGRPVAVVRGLARSVLPPGDHGPGAAALVRPAAEDMFGLGSREAAVAAAAAHRRRRRCATSRPGRRPTATRSTDLLDGLVGDDRPHAEPGHLPAGC